MTPADVIAAHKQSGDTRFFHRDGESHVEYPSCRCGAKMHPRDHPQHVIDSLQEAGFVVHPVGQ